jgi:hypothetical protein
MAFLQTEQQLTVGGGLGGGGRRDDGARSRLVLDQEGPAEPLLELLSEHARENVGAAARREGHHDDNGMRWIILRPCDRGEQGSCGGSGQAQERSSFELHGDPP